MSAKSWEHVWLRVTPRHEYNDDVLDDWCADGWEVVSVHVRARSWLLGFLPAPTFALLRRPI